MRGAKRLRWTEVDRLLAIALALHEDSLCPGCGQPLHESTDPDMAGWWTTAAPVRCGACTALAGARERDKDHDHPHALHYLVGLSEGWEESVSAARAERAASQE